MSQSSRPADDPEQPARTLLSFPPEFACDVRAAVEAEQSYVRPGDRAALESAATAWSRILEHAAFLSAPERVRLPMLNSAGVIFVRRYRAGGRVDDLNRALDLWEQAVKVTPPNSPDLATYLSNLGNGFGERFERTGRETDLEAAIRAFQQAVKVTPPDSPALARYLNSLGAKLGARFAGTERKSDLEATIRVFQQAVKVTPPDSPELARGNPKR